MKLFSISLFCIELICIFAAKKLTKFNKKTYAMESTALDTKDISWEEINYSLDPSDHKSLKRF